VIFTSFGDMLRVPGSSTDLLAVKSAGATCAWSTRRSMRSSWRRSNPDREVVFFAVGFETTAPPTPWPSGRPIDSV
jgi:hydrogenase expression/formation protein HypD